MKKIWNQIVQGRENETAMMHSRMGKPQKFGVSNFTPVQQQIKVNCARAVWHITCAPQGVFNPQ